MKETINSDRIDIRKVVTVRTDGMLVVNPYVGLLKASLGLFLVTCSSGFVRILVCLATVLAVFDPGRHWAGLGVFRMCR